MEQREEQKTEKKTIFFLLWIVIAFLIGFCFPEYLRASIIPEGTFIEHIIRYAMIFAGLYLVKKFHTIIHEAGHLLFGIMTGYKFLSFQVGSFMLMKSESGIHLYHYSIPCIAGQCLMVPPEMEKGKIPVVLYNMGGVIINAIVSVVFLGLALFFSNVRVVSCVFFGIALVGIFYVCLNGIPMRLKDVTNDGFNAKSIYKNPEAIKAFWLQLKINEQLSYGVRLKDMPADWFVTSVDEANNKNSMCAPIAYFACERMIDAMELSEAVKTMEELAESDIKMEEVHQMLISVQQIYCELVGEKRPDVLENLFTSPVLKFMKVMKKYPAVLRTEFAYSLLEEKDSEKAEEIRDVFEKIAAKYPYPSEIEGERERIEYAMKKSSMCEQVSDNVFAQDM